jgi:hypothetical protein
MGSIVSSAVDPVKKLSFFLKMFNFSQDIGKAKIFQSDGNETS